MIRPQSFVEWTMLATTSVGAWLVVHAVVFGPWWLWPVGLLLVVAAAELFGLRLWVEMLKQDNARWRERAREYLVRALSAEVDAACKTGERSLRRKTG